MIKQEQRELDKAKNKRGFGKMIDLQRCNEEEKEMVDDLIYLYETGQEFFSVIKNVVIVLIIRGIKF